MNRFDTQPTVIFDGDDTLWETQSLYTDAKSLFVENMMEMGFPREHVRARFEAIDHANVTRLGFTKLRFPQSMSDTYRALCVEYARQYDEKKAQHVRSIGATVFQASPKLFDGVDDVLSGLQKHGVKLLLATKGDQDVQQRRVESSRLQRYFKRTYILAEKGIEEFQRIVAEQDIILSSGWSVGNSARSDIVPALAIGLSTIWIPRKTWTYEDEEPVNNPRLYRATSLIEVPGIVLGGV